MPRPYTEGLVRSYDAHVHEREARGEPEWRSPYRTAFAALLPPGGRVLEIGAGVGYSAQWFASEGFTVLATDVSPGNVAQCRTKGVAAEVVDIVTMDLREEPFDGVWAASCLMHIADADLPAALGNVARAMAPHGLFWAGTWSGDDEEGIWEDDFYEPKRFYSFRSDAKLRSIYETTFEVLTFETTDPEPDLGRHYQMALMRRRSHE